jgi:hypothetical protein
MYNVQYFTQWEAALREKVLATLPAPPDCFSATYLPALKSVDEAYQAVEQAKRNVDRLEKLKQQAAAAAAATTAATTAAAASPSGAPQGGPAFDEAELTGAKTSQEGAQRTLDDSIAACEAAGFQILDELDQSLCSASFDDTDLITYVTLKTVGAKKWAEWCAKGETEAAMITSTLFDASVLRSFHGAGGGPRANNWLKAIEIHSQLHPSSRQHPVLRRLALAVALELAGDIPVKVVQHDLDPLERYLHYEKAYLEGELDPVFEQLSAWELRMVIDSDASEEELALARQGLRNYRPDHVLTDDPQWRYCRIVRTDVGYTQPDWYKPKRSYDQILSGGGKCGPRAWYGRFICKAFGVPTWGCKQPGHAAMARWTSNGWQTCLGGGLRVSNWENKTGPFFNAEMKALYAVRSEDAYLRRIWRLWMVGNAIDAIGEHSRDLLGRAIPSARCPWKSLALLQMQRLAARAPSLEPLYPRTHQVETILEKTLSAPAANEQILNDTRHGVTVVPATCASNKARCTDMPCFEGGKQLLLGENNAEVEYALQPHHLKAGAASYRLTIRVCTVHRNEDSATVSFTTSSGGGSAAATQTFSVAIPYTSGMWQDTDPVLVTLAPDSGAVVKLVRGSRKYAISIRSLQLTAVA